MSLIHEIMFPIVPEPNLKTMASKLQEIKGDEIFHVFPWSGTAQLVTQPLCN